MIPIVGATAAKAVELGAQLKELALRETGAGSPVLRPNLEVIQSQSLEALIQNNLEKTVEGAEAASSELLPLPEELAQTLKAEGILSPNAVEALQMDDSGTLRLPCRNEHLAGQVHEVTGVPYAEKVADVGSVQIKVVVPEFPCRFTVQVPEAFWKKGDAKLFEFCTRRLEEELEVNPKLARQFTPQQLEQIKNGDGYIKGLTWHHSEVPGRMELVDSRLHALSSHTGGNTIWCGGIR